MRLSMFLPALLASALPLLSHAGNYQPQVEIYDRTDHRTLPVYLHGGDRYVAGEPGHQYELRVRNPSGERVLAVTSVDGVNVITGKTADPQQTGYVLQPWEDLSIEGWRKSMDDVATFYFTRLSNSYAARTGRRANVGVIGVAVFREYQPCCRNAPQEDLAASSPEARSDDARPAREESKASSQGRVKEKLGTGHGHREQSHAQYVDFQRASDRPEETVVIYYDSKQNLLAQGIIPKHRHYAENDRRPNPFPQGGFVPDP
jgi:hypothetical protein